ncbi:hypothetical protein ACA910_014619 [Epithemia clementina (nom. ined.)]
MKAGSLISRSSQIARKAHHRCARLACSPPSLTCRPCGTATNGIVALSTGREAEGQIIPMKGFRRSGVAMTFLRCSTSVALPDNETLKSDGDGEEGNNAIVDRECVGEGHKVILDQESDPDMLFHSLGMKKSELYELASQKPTPLALADIYKSATAVDKRQRRLRNARFLHRELPIRVAQRAVDLLTLPDGLSEVKHIQQVACVYISKLHALLSVPIPQTYEEEDQFTDLLQQLALDRSYIPTAISQGLTDWSGGRREVERDRLQQMEHALYRFFTAHVGLRLLIEQHVLSSHRESAKALRKVTHMFPDDEDNFSGCINANVDLVKEISRVAKMVVQQTKDFYGDCPEIEIVDGMDKKNTGEFTYIPNHLHYMMGELLKNSCRATIRHFQADGARRSAGQQGVLGALARASVPKMPPVRVIVVKGDEDVTIKVADKGGGIPRSRMAKIWKFAHSTADEGENSSEFGMDSLSGTRIRGFGLPLCRIYARYLGGELTLKSMEGHGLDAYLHLPRLGVACENLPDSVKWSPGEGDSTPSRNLRSFSEMGIATSNSRSGTQSTQPTISTEVLMEELRHCLTKEAQNECIRAFLKSRVC